MEPKTYEPSVIEPKWQEHWIANKTFRAEDDFSKPKYYVLDMFPYPSGSGLHVGHPEGYTATDIMARYKRMRGFNVLHPMGWDAFGLPAEQYAIKTGTHPREKTAENVARFKEQLNSIGFAYDWDREVNTTDPGYYKWTQWIFLKLYEQGLAYIAEVPVNWCPALGTVLANEEVIDGRSERGGHPVVRKPMRQWMLKITAYAERLLNDLETLDWPEKIKAMQRHWIGKSVGGEVVFKVQDAERTFKIFTTRPDTLFGATYMVLSPEHPLVDEVTTAEQREAVDAYREQAARKSDLQRAELAKEKTGVFTGGYAINPVNDEAIPIWIADYVLMSYGTGAIMAVPGHDERDWEFAKTFGLPIVQVIGHPDADIEEAAYTGDGTLVNSQILDGKAVPEAKETIIAWLEERGLGKKAINYKLRDWLFSRQRYWGEPFPVVLDEDGEPTPLPEEHLPLLLPEVESYQPTGTGEPPLAQATEWVETTHPETGEPAWRETNTMPQWAGSCWYYLRYIDPQNDEAAWDAEKENYWMPVDLYVGGAEHAVLHLLYARFWHKVLYDIGAVSTVEPFQRLINQGMILGFAYRYYRDPESGEVFPHTDAESTDDGMRHKESGALLLADYVAIPDVDWRDETPYHPEHPELVLEVLTEKMSKSRGNVVNPDDIIEEYGADSLRLYEMYMGPLENVKPWNTDDIIGLYRFLGRVWRLVVDRDSGAISDRLADVEPDRDALRAYHQCVQKVTEDTEAMRFNTAIAAMIEFTNAMYKMDKVPRAFISPFLQLLSPYAPHIAEELWHRVGHDDTIANEPWPEFDPELAAEDTIDMPIQVNGKVRATLAITPDAAKDDVLAMAKAHERIQEFTAGKTIVREIYVPGRIINLVVK